MDDDSSSELTTYTYFIGRLFTLRSSVYRCVYGLTSLKLNCTYTLDRFELSHSVLRLFEVNDFAPDFFKQTGIHHMSQQPRTRQELYDLIRETSRDEFILAEMKRLGFWKSNDTQPSLPETLIHQRGELQRDLRELVAKERKLENPEELLKAYRKKRLETSRKQQEENREKREKARQEKAAAWQLSKANEIIFLGKNISGGLQNKTNQSDKLKENNLPVFEDAKALAQAMDIPLATLRFLAYDRKVSKVSHYKRFYMQKKSGGQRLISAPLPMLKKAQYWILENVLGKLDVHHAANGFCEKRSIISNAQPHVGKSLVLNLDFKDFFPSIKYRRIKGLFIAMGYSEHIAIILAAICTEPDTYEVEMDGENYFVAQGERHLPQGAPTSPVLTNLLCYKLDRRLEGLAKRFDYAYTRYADDLTFSTNKNEAQIHQLIWCIRQITKEESFVLHPEKLRIMRKGQRQEATGLVVNQTLGIDRKKLRKFRALLHQIKVSGWEGKQWGKSPNLPAAVWGYANFVKMIKPEKGTALVKEVKALMKTIPANYSTGKINRAALRKNQTPNSKNEKDQNKPGWRIW